MPALHATLLCLLPARTHLCGLLLLLLLLHHTLLGSSYHPMQNAVHRQHAQLSPHTADGHVTATRSKHGQCFMLCARLAATAPL
jgi:hypothetical protein